MTFFGSVLKLKPIEQVRRNHALEHATLHILAKKRSNQFLAGHSDAYGIRIIGDVPTEEIQLAVDEALARRQSGEKRLAYHPNCGTNFATAGVLAGLTAWTGMLGSGKSFKEKFNRLPLVILLVTIVLILSRPLGPYLQQYVTTDANPGTLKIIEIRRHDFAHFVLHRICTQY
jgi:hypothetical protein